MRRLLIAMLALVAFAATGCTTNDRDYVRNHIVLHPSAAGPVLAAAKSPVPSAPAEGWR